MQVLKDQYRRALLGQRLQEPPPGRERLGLPVTTGLARARQADQPPQVPGDPGRLGVIAEQVGHGPVQLGGGRLRRVGLQDSCLGLDHLPQRPEGDRFAVG